jgi:hypothetical protein
VLSLDSAIRRFTPALDLEQMSKFLSSAKSGSEWTQNELTTFDIQVVRVHDIASFFGGSSVLPEANVSPLVLNNVVNMRPDLAKDERLLSEKAFFIALQLSTKEGAYESAINDFSQELLRISGYGAGLQHIAQKRPMKFCMSGQIVEAVPDVCVMRMVSSNQFCALLVQKSKVSSITMPF